MLAVLMLASLGLTNAPAVAQQAPARWTPHVESIIVRAGAPKNWRMALSASRLGTAFVITASIPVPYSDLNLARDPDAAELDRRIHVAARLVCQQMDSKYPPTQYPILEGYSGDECARVAASEGMEHANMIIASAKH
jgi:UrcA family protein